MWVEMGKYARYMVLGLLLSFIPSSILIAPAWLLDDAGIVYYVRWNAYRGVNDIDSVSSWFLNFLEGVFGITAVSSWLTLFLPMIQNLGRLRIGLSGIPGVPPAFGLVVIIIALLLFPLLATTSIINSCNKRMEENVVSNSKRLFKRMKKKDYDLIPKNIEEVLSSKDEKHPGPWTKYYNEIGFPIENEAIEPPVEKTENIEEEV